MRHIDPRFLRDLVTGELSYFFDRVKSDPRHLCLAIRNHYVNIYYKGGSLLRITQKANGYLFHFDEKYCKRKDGNHLFELLDKLKNCSADTYRSNFDSMMKAMDGWFFEHRKPERDYQHRLLVHNPEIVDIEYQIGRSMRLDMLLFANGKLSIVENKYGNGAISGKAGLAKHYQDICHVLSRPELLDELLDSICHIATAKKALGLSERQICREEIQSVEILFLLADYNPRGQGLSNELKIMKGPIPVSILKVDSKQTRLDLRAAERVFIHEN